MTKTSYLTAVTSAIEDCQKDNLDIIVKLIVSIDRRNQLHEAEEVVDLALAFRSRGVIGIDLCGDVEVGLFENLRPAFERAKKHGFPLTLHFNEIVPNMAEAPTLLSIQPNRLGHATFLDDYCRKTIYEQNIPIEICMTSNVLCKTVKSFEEHHIKELLYDNHPFILCVSHSNIQ
jgi:adenosine deaminase